MEGGCRVNAKKLVLALALVGVASLAIVFALRHARGWPAAAEHHVSPFSDSPFSAGITITGKGTTYHGKMYASATALRTDVDTGPGMTASVIVRYDKGITWILSPDAHYIQTPIEKRTDLVSALRDPDARIEKKDAGTAQIGAYSCRKYRVTATMNGRTQTGWIWVAQAKDLHGFIVQATDDASGETISFSNIRLGAPAASLFDLPPGAQQLRPGSQSGSNATPH
jgi:hypothetical protein